MSLVPTLTVRVVGDSVEFTLRVANGGEGAVLLAFATTQRYDFSVSDSGGSEVWRWSSEQMFGQAVGEESIEAGGILEYREVWPAAGLEGLYQAEARLVSTDRPVTLTTEFELAGG